MANTTFFETIPAPDNLQYLSDSHLPWIPLAAALCTLAVWLCTTNSRLKHAPYLAAPRNWYGLPKDYNRYMEEGYQRFKNAIFSVPTDSGPLLILPQKFVNEVKALPDTHASFRKSFEFWFLNAHTNIGGDDQHQMALIHAAKHHLTKHKDLTKLLAAVQEELSYAFEQELPQSTEWTDVTIYPVMIRIVARLIARVFVGPDLCRDPNYLDISITYTVNCLRVSRVLAWCPPLLRPLMKVLVPGYLDLRRQERRMQQLLAPVIKQRQGLTASGRDDKPEDLLQWFIDDSAAKQKDDKWFLAISQINASLAAIHSTAIVATNAIFDVATRAQYMQPLRDEAMSLAEPGAAGPPPDMRLLSLPKLDSFLKESQRMNPLGLIGLMRMSVADIKLSDGSTIPRDSQFAFAMKSMSYDKAIWDEPERFNGFRFEEIAQSISDPADNHWRFVSSNQQSYSFGHGSHACPGRHFAAMELKIILINLLLKYDLQSDGLMEYKTGIRGFMLLPDVDKTLSLRRR